MSLEHMMEAMQNLKRRDLHRLKHLLNKKPMNGKTIPWCELENADVMKMTDVLKAYHSPNHVQTLMEVLNDVPRKDLAEMLRNEVKAEKEKTRGSDETDGPPPKRPRLSEPGPYQGRFRLSDLEAYAAKNQDQLIKQLEDYLDSNRMSRLKERLAHSKLKNSFVFSAKQCYTLQSNQDLKEFLRKVTSAKKAKNIPEKILGNLFPITESSIKRRAMDYKQDKGNINSQEVQERSGRGYKAASSSPDGSLAERKNQWKELPANKKKGSPPVSPNLSSVELIDSDEEKNTPKPMYEKMDVLQPSEIPVHAVEESQNTESQMPKAENSSDEAIRIWCSSKKEGNCDFDYVGVWEHEKYDCFVAEDVIRFRLPGDTEYGLLKILQDKNDLTRTGKLTKNLAFELQFNMAVLGAPRADVISPVSDFFEVVQFNHSFAEFEKFFNDVVCKIVLPILALYKRVQVDLLQKALDVHRL